MSSNVDDQIDPEAPEQLLQMAGQRPRWGMAMDRHAHRATGSLHGDNESLEGTHQAQEESRGVAWPLERNVAR
jgi:hypothetical protein